MSKFEQEETQRLLGELLQGFLDCGDMIRNPSQYRGIY